VDPALLTALIQIVDGSNSPHTCLSRFSCPLTGVLCKLPFADSSRNQNSVEVAIGGFLPAM
jgi:hypothetical protein